MTYRPFAALTTFCLVAALARGQCLSQGMTIQSHGGRLGDAWSVEMTGTPSTVAVLGFDLAPGPSVTPFGTICLGLTPALQSLFFLFSPAGAATFNSLMPVNLSLVGFTVHLAGVAFDATQPSGFALSNDAALTAHQPRLYFVSPGVSSPFGGTPGSVAALNLVTDDVAFSQALATTVLDATFVRERGWLVVLLANSTLAVIDGVTGASVMNVPLTGASASAQRVLAPAVGDRVLLVSPGSAPGPFGGGVPGAVHTVLLPSGAISTVALAAGNPDAALLAPGTTTMFLRLFDAVVPFDWAAGAAQPPIALPTTFGVLSDWQVAGGTLYVLHAGRAPTPFGGGQPGALSAVDVNAPSLLYTSPLTTAVPVQMLRAGPGTTGPSLYVYSSTSGALDEFAQGAATPTGTVAVGSGITAMELSSLGTQWLLLCNGGGCGSAALLSMAAGTTTVSSLTPLGAGPQPKIGVSPSATFGKGCVVIGGNSAVPFGSDPFAPAPLPTTLPFSSTQFRIVSD